MLATLKKNIGFAIIIFLFSLPLLSFFRSIKKKFQSKLYRKTGLFINFYFGSISFLTIFLGKIYFRTAGYSIVAQKAHLNFSLQKRLLRRRNSFFALDISEINLIIRYRDGTAAKKNDQPQPDNLKYVWEKSVYPIFRKGLNILFTISQFNFKVNRMHILMRYGNLRIVLNANQLTKEKDKIYCNAELSVYKFLVKTSFNVKVDSIRRVLSIKQLEKSSISQNNEDLIIAIDNFYVDFFVHSDADFECMGSMNDIMLDHEKIAQNSVEVEHIAFNIPFIFDKEKFFISNKSNIDFNGIEFSLNLQHDCKEADLLKLSLLFLLDGESFFKAYPFFIIKELENLGAEGRVILKLDYMTSFSDLSSYYFKVSTIENTFKIINKISFDLSFLNNKFVHPCKVNRNNYTRKIHLSSDNSFYLPLTNIPDVLVKLFILAEDPHFYYHNGIHDYAIGLAIALNINYRKFKRGASTIPMQLVRNLFLYQTKTVSRKLEELLLAWLMINQFHIPKKRILEIYFNIIEFGENVYGISEAANYYFDKQVRELNISEYLVLSYIIPRPKYFLEAVQMKSPQLIKNLTFHMETYSKILLEGKVINEDMIKNINFTINFRSSIGKLKLK